MASFREGGWSVSKIRAGHHAGVKLSTGVLVIHRIGTCWNDRGGGGFLGGGDGSSGLVLLDSHVQRKGQTNRPRSTAQRTAIYQRFLNSCVGCHGPDEPSPVRSLETTRMTQPQKRGGQGARPPDVSTNEPGLAKQDTPPLSSGGANGIRTRDLLVANEARYRLRYSPLAC